MKKKILLTILAVVLLTAASVAGTAAYLTYTSDRVENTFVAAGGGKLVESFYLRERAVVWDDTLQNYVFSTDAVSDESYTESSVSYDLVATGMQIPKDPAVLLDLPSGVDAYLFVKISGDLDDRLAWSTGENWQSVSLTLTDGTLWCYKGSPIRGTDGVEVHCADSHLLRGNCLTVGDGVSAGGGQPLDLGELKFTAYVCQAMGFSSPAEAFEACFLNGG